MLSFGLTDIGKRREVNQDSFIIDRISESRLLAVVCDGMGGVSGGLEASTIASHTFADYVGKELEEFSDDGLSPNRAREILSNALRFANKEVFDASCENDALTGMGTTLVAVLVFDGSIYAVNVGDSRMYLISNTDITQITHDHSYVQFLVDIGQMSEDEAKVSSNRNIITRAVGTSEEIESDFFSVDTTDCENPLLLLCSDGLTNMLSPDKIALYTHGDITDENCLCEMCTRLISQANENGGKDNITAVLVSL